MFRVTQFFVNLSDKYCVRCILVMGRDQNLCESSMNVISYFTIFVNFELCELQYFIFFVIF